MSREHDWSRILIVEDDPGQLETLLKLVQEEGYVAVGCATASEARTHAEREPFGVAVLDLQLSDDTGSQLLEFLKHNNPNIRVIINTAYATLDSAKEAVNSGAFGYLEKDSSPIQLLDQIRRAMQHRWTQYTQDLEEAIGERTAELREREEQFRQLVEHIQEVFWMVSPDESHLFYVSPVYEAIWGRTCDSLRQDPTSLWQVLHPQDQERIQAARSVMSREEVQEEFRIVLQDGSMRWIRARTFPIRNEQGQVIRIAGVAEDMTQHKRVEEALTKSERHFRQSSRMEAIGTLAGGIAHDFNNILTAILGYTELALATVPKNSRTQRNLQEVLTAGHRAKHLVQQILTFSRQAGPGKRSIPLHTILREALKLLRATIPSTITIQHSIKTEANIVADPTQIHQIFINLCTNAEYAMREKGGVLHLTLEDATVTDQMAHMLSGLAAGEYVRLTVRDTGIGMTPEVLERMFDPFFTTKPIGEGSGMGLAVVHGLVTSHGGAIWVESGIGKGTKIEVYLPRAQNPVWEYVPDQSPIPVGRETILFVDDEETIVRLGQELLTSLGYSVEVETYSPQALATFMQDPHRFDLVITDQTMPSMTGEMLSRELLRIRPDLPIILCTGFSHIMSAEKAKALGIQAYLMKPLAIRDLAPIVRHVLDKAASPLAET
ncbi:MAG: response regulator [Nitrospirales bacterium]